MSKINLRISEIRWLINRIQFNEEEIAPIKIMANQASAISNLIAERVPKKAILEKCICGEFRDTELDGLSLEPLAIALYIGYKVYPNYSAGDWVTITDKFTGDDKYVGVTAKVLKNDSVLTGLPIEIDMDGGSQAFSLDEIKHANTWEVDEEKERRKEMESEECWSPYTDVECQECNKIQSLPSYRSNGDRCIRCGSKINV